jgi:hypothetical protein
MKGVVLAGGKGARLPGHDRRYALDSSKIQN